MILQGSQNELPRRLQASTAEFLLLEFDHDAKKAISGTHSADLHGTAGQSLQFERHIAEKGRQIGSDRLVSERRQPGAETSGAVSQVLLGYGGAIRYIEFYFQYRTSRPDIGATQDPDVLKFHDDPCTATDSAATTPHVTWLIVTPSGRPGKTGYTLAGQGARPTHGSGNCESNSCAVRQSARPLKR